MSSSSSAGPDDHPPSNYLEILTIRISRSKVMFIPVKYILLAEAHDHYIKLYYQPHEKLQHVTYRSNFSTLAGLLPPTHFRQVSRSHIMNVYELQFFDEDAQTFLTHYGDCIKLEHFLGVEQVPQPPISPFFI